VTETERADRIARRSRRRWLQTVAMVLALVLGLTALLLVWHDLETRTETAETSAVSLAEQVQDACESQGSLDLDGRDLCQQADDVVEDPGLTRTPADGHDGRDGVDGRDGTDGVDGLDGKPGKDGADGKPGVDGIDGEPGTDGADGTDGLDGLDGVDGAPGADGADGSDGADGTNGSDGRGISDIVCHTTGDWIITLTDGTALTVTGPCRVTQPSPTPTPTASTTKK
jgi:hypothetical protein